MASKARSRQRPPVAMPFGKYKGERVADLPDNYLEWLWDNVELREPLRSVVDREWHQRFGDDYDDDLGGGDDHDHDYDLGGDDLDGDERALLREIIATGFRTLCFRYHPDAGGSVEDMRRLNALMEKLRRGLLAA